MASDLRRLREDIDKLMDFRAAIMEPQPGSPQGTRAPIEMVHIMSQSYQRGSWAVRAAVWLITTAVVIGGALQTLRSWFSQ